MPTSMSDDRLIAAALFLAIIAYFFFGKNNKGQQITASVKKGNFPIEVTTTGELMAKSSEKIYGPAGLRQIQIWQVKIQDIIPDGTVQPAPDTVQRCSGA